MRNKKFLLNFDHRFPYFSIRKCDLKYSPVFFIDHYGFEKKMLQTRTNNKEK
jgi:hypothetical protein